MTFCNTAELVLPVVSNPKKVVHALRWAVCEMDKRYAIFAKTGVRNIGAFNARPESNSQRDSAEERIARMMTAQDRRQSKLKIPNRLPYIVIIIDDFENLLFDAYLEIRDEIVGMVERIARIGHKAGVHLLLSGLSARVAVLSGTLKASIPSRISFSLSSQKESFLMLDESGAENLGGPGNFIYRTSPASVSITAHAALVSDGEVNRMVQHAATQ